MCASVLAAHSGAASRARHWLSCAEGALERRLQGRRSKGLIGAIAVVEAALAPSARAMLDVTAQACELQDPDSQWRGPLCLLHGVGLHLSGASSTAATLLEHGAEFAAMPAPLVAADCLAVAAMIAIEREDMEWAGQLADHALAVIEERDLSRDPHAALAFSAAAAARAGLGRADESRRDLDTSLRLLASFESEETW